MKMTFLTTVAPLTKRTRVLEHSSDPVVTPRPPAGVSALRFAPGVSWCSTRWPGGLDSGDSWGKYVWIHTSCKATALTHSARGAGRGRRETGVVGGAPCGAVLRRGPWRLQTHGPASGNPGQPPPAHAPAAWRGRVTESPRTSLPCPQYQDGNPCLTGLFEDEDRAWAALPVLSAPGAGCPREHPSLQTATRGSC